jgi:hypothetical protein
MAGVTRAHPLVASLIDGPKSYAGKAVTILAVDLDVDADGSALAMIAALSTIQRYGNILIQGAVHDTGSKIDVIMEGDLSGSDYVSADGTVTGTVGAAMVEDLINLATIDGVDFTSGTTAVTVRSNLITA